MLIRLLLLIPQFIVVWLLGIVTFFVAIAAWFAALVTGRLPEWAARFLSGYVAYTTRVTASWFLLVDSYPPFSFTAPDYPVQLELHPGGHLNRLAVLFRIILAIPAIIITSVVTGGWSALCFFCWLVVLVLGRVPGPLFESSAAILRYSMRFSAYFLMLTPSYPKRLFGDSPGSAPADPAYPAGSDRSATRPLLLATGGKVLLVVFIVFGIGAAIGNGIGNSGDQSNQGVQVGASAGHR